MSIQAITTKVISTLGNKESLIPIMIKDGVDSASLTYKSYKEGGSIEGTDRAIDEFGTQAIWIGGIPFYKKLIDLTLYKHAKINPQVDPRIIANKEYSNWALKNAQGIMTNSKSETVKDALSKCLVDGGKKAKALYAGKVAAATALTLGTFFLLTKSKQKNTKNTVLKDMNEKTISNDVNVYENNNKIFDDITSFSNKKGSTQSFKGLGKNVAEAILFNPVHNMQIIDAGITAERIGCSRNKTEFVEHSIKEFGFLFFLYKFGNMIEDGINSFSANVLNKPIDLSIDVLMDEKLKTALKEGTILSDIANIPQKTESLTEKLNFIIQNPDNIVVQAAKKSKIISTVKDSSGKSVVDTSKYIDINDFEALVDNLKNIDKKFKLSNENVKSFLNKTKGLKIASVAANVGISCLFLGYIIPKLVFKYRELKTGTTKFHVEQDIRNNKN